MKLPLKTIVAAVAASPQGRKAVKNLVTKLNTPANRAKAQDLLKQVNTKSNKGRSTKKP